MKKTLKNLHTFAVDVNARKVFFFSSVDELIEIYKKEKNERFIILGQGSNVLFVEDFAGNVLINKIKGLNIYQDATHYYLEIGSGEVLHEIIIKTLEQGIYGLENLALIPGSIGSAAIQNVGAYGADFKMFCDYVDILDFDSLEIKRLTAKECNLSYRDSIFKETLNKVCITKVGLKLPINWQPNLSYSPLSNLNPEAVTAQEIFKTVCAVRQEKLPDPKKLASAGSFFKNPIISQAEFEKLQAKYPNIVHYKQTEGFFKLAAGWLIDQCNLKGYSIGDACVHEKQALVIVNKDNATSDDIINLANYVVKQVFDKFNVTLEPEVICIGKHGIIENKKFNAL